MISFSRYKHIGRQKMKIFSFVMCTLIVHLFAFGTASGKCPYRNYKITGNVQEDNTNLLIAGVKLYFFFDDLQLTLTNGYKTEYPDYFKTDEKGAFSATVYFDSYSGWFITDRCNKIPENLTIIVSAEGYPARRIKYKLKKLLRPDGAINLPPISLSKSN
jgi:hypothetical protein